MITVFLSVKRIINYYRFGYKTEIRREFPQYLSDSRTHAGCDLLTISPDLLQKLADADNTNVKPKLNPEAAQASDLQRIAVDESPSASHSTKMQWPPEKLAEAYDYSIADTLKLEQIIAGMR